MKVFQMTRFKRYVKKLPRHFQQVILDALEDVVTNTEVGELKKGDLEGIQVYKFTMGRQLILMAYKVENDSLVLYQAGPHENFYRDLKKYLKETGGVKMLTAQKVIHEIYLLPKEEKEKLAHHITLYGIMGAHRDSPEILNLKEWQDDIAKKPFNLKQASEYLGISAVTLRRWVKKDRLVACKAGRAYTFDVLDLKRFKKEHLTLKVGEL